MAKFSDITIIYNPVSTGSSKSMAFDLRSNLRKHFKNLPIKCLPTKYAGHAREIARTLAIDLKTPLIISSSGDGGYNEVVNGVMDAGSTKAVCAVLPAGNANDHSRTMHDQPLLTEIIKGKVTRLDLLKVCVETDKKESLIKYAHSYAGLGLTPAIGAELNRHSLNKFNEILLVIKTFRRIRPFTIVHRGRKLKLDSLLFANINQMAKVLTLAQNNQPDDGLFEVITFAHASKIKLIKRLAKATLTALNTSVSRRTYVFDTVKKLPMQMDGELWTLPARSKITVTSAHKALRTVI